MRLPTRVHRILLVHIIQRVILEFGSIILSPRVTLQKPNSLHKFFPLSLASLCPNTRLQLHGSDPKSLANPSFLSSISIFFFSNNPQVCFSFLSLSILPSSSTYSTARIWLYVCFRPLFISLFVPLALNYSGFSFLFLLFSIIVYLKI